MLYLFKITVKGSRDEILSELYYNDEKIAKDMAQKIKDCCDVDTYVCFEDVSNFFNQYDIDKVLELSKVL